MIYKFNITVTIYKFSITQFRLGNAIIHLVMSDVKYAGC